MSIQKIDSQDYDALLTRCKPLVASAKQHAKDYVRDNWQLGKELLDVPRKYGGKTIIRLSRDLSVSSSHMYACIQFVEQNPSFEGFINQFSNVGKLEVAWRDIQRKLSEPRKSTSLPTNLPTPSQLPSNPAATPDEIRHAYDPRRDPPPTSESKPALMFREILTWLQISHISEKEIQVETERGPRTYHADFLVGRTILEVDSELHDSDKDEQRDKDLQTLGYETVRFRDTEIQAAHKLLSSLLKVATVEKVAVY